MNNTIKVFLWLLVIFIVIIIYFFQKRNKQINQKFNLSEAFNIALASGGLITSISVFYNLANSPQLKELLDKELGFDVIALYLGAIATGWVSLQPIARFFQVRNFTGTVLSIRNTNTENLIYLEVFCKNKKSYQVVLTEDMLTRLIGSTSHQNLIGKNITILDVIPIESGTTKELKIARPDQLVIT